MSPSILVVNDGNIVDNIDKPIQINDEAPAKPSKSAVMHRSLLEDPLRVVAAQGNHLQLSNGQKIFDATGGAAVACLGHGDIRYVFASVIKGHESDDTG